MNRLNFVKQNIQIYKFLCNLCHRSFSVAQYLTNMAFNYWILTSVALGSNPVHDNMWDSVSVCPNMTPAAAGGVRTCDEELYGIQ